MRWTLRILLGLLAVGLFGYFVFLRATRIDPPPITSEMRHRAERPLEVRGARSYIGESWMTRERGIWELHLSGEPYALGWAQARLGQRILLRQEDYLFDEMAHYVPSRFARFLIRAGVRLRYRKLGDSIPLPRRQEIAGLANALYDEHSDFLPAYHRLVFYHALHDITQGLERSPLLGCTAFAASGSATTNGHLIIGRNFDFEGPTIFDEEKAVLFFKPAGKIPFASVAWLGMTGVVTGLNAEGIYISINAARSDDKGEGGMPVEILAREVLEQAHTLDEAIAMIKKTPVFVPDFYLLGDGKTGESAVVERTPARAEVRRSHDVTLLTNHALSPAFTHDAENDRLRRYTTSGSRFKRLTELVQRHRGALDARRALEILRDKRGTGGDTIGIGNRNALDALIATHSVVVDATNLVLWISQGPHLLGKFIAFDLRRELLGEERPQSLDMPVDPLLLSDELRAYEEALSSLRSADHLSGKAPDRAIEELEKAEALVEKMPEPHRKLGDLLRTQGRTEEAIREYRRFLELAPPYLADIEEVKGILGTLQ
jgi:isopenicillin-N N-acyltransferase-like protein